MGLLTRLWLSLTRRLLDGEDIGTAGGYTVVADGFDERDLADLLDLPAYRDPVTELRDLPDEPGRIYLWTCDDDARATALNRQFTEAGAQNLDAIHMIVADETELQELSKADLEPYIGGEA